MQSMRNPDFNEGLDVRHLLRVSKAQDVHISCPHDLVEVLLLEFQQQFADTAVEIYDWGQSDRFQQGYIVLSWQSHVPQTFKQQLDTDPRLEGYSVYDLPANLVVPRVLAERL